MCGQCQYPGCQHLGARYFYPEYLLKDRSKLEIYCSDHAKQAGFCYRCGDYAVGDHIFSWCDGDLCDRCSSEINAQMFPVSNDGTFNGNIY